MPLPKIDTAGLGSERAKIRETLLKISSIMSDMDYSEAIIKLHEIEMLLSAFEKAQRKKIISNLSKKNVLAFVNASAETHNHNYYKVMDYSFLINMTTDVGFDALIGDVEEFKEIYSKLLSMKEVPTAVDDIGSESYHRYYLDLQYESTYETIITLLKKHDCKCLVEKELVSSGTHKVKFTVYSQ